MRHVGMWLDPNQSSRAQQMMWSLHGATCSVWCFQQHMRTDCRREVKLFFVMMFATWCQVVCTGLVTWSERSCYEITEVLDHLQNHVTGWRSAKFCTLKEIIINSPEWMQFLGLSGSVGGDPQKFCCLTCWRKGKAPNILDTRVFRI